MFFRYRAGGGEAGKLVFFRACRQAHLLHTKNNRFDFFSCIDCLHARDEAARLLAEQADLENRPALDLTELVKCRLAYLELQNHVTMDRHQQNSFRSIQERLTVGQLLLVMDFGMHQVKEKEESSSNRYADLIFVFYWRGDDGVLEWEYVDCMAVMNDPLKNKKDLSFVETAFLSLIAEGRFLNTKELWIWSDCGPSHFRTSNTLYFFSQMQQVIKVKTTVCFFYPRHGHSAADRHHGSTKKHLKYVLKSLADDYEIPNRDLLVRELEKCRFTTVQDLPPIETHQKMVKTLAGIMEYLVFEFPEDVPSAVDCRRMFGGDIERKRFDFC